MATTIGFGPNPDAKYVTTYFRTSFRATNGVSKLTLTLRRDDGAIVYLNGREVARSNMASGTVTADALAPVVIGGSDETAVITMPIVATLRRGTNVIAVEVHQAAVTSSDLAFDLSLTGTGNTGRLR